MTMPGLTVNVLNAIYHRRSVRSYTPQRVSAAQVQALLEAAAQAPTARHEEPWAFVVVQEPRLLQRISAAVSDEMRQSWGLLAVGDKTMRAPDGDPLHGAGTLVLICCHGQGPFVAADCWLAAENFMLAAHAMGLGTCVIGSALHAVNNKLRHELGIPADITAQVPIVLGYAREEPPVVSRKPPRILNFFAASKDG
jgi:nitroreductase